MFRRTLFLLVALLALWGSNLEAASITWLRTYIPANVNVSVNTTLLPLEDGFLIANYWGVNRNGCWITRADSRGQPVWNRFFGAPLGVYTGYATLQALHPAPGGGFWVAGTLERPGKSLDFWLMRLDEHGWPQWSRVFGGQAEDHLFAAHPTTDQGYALAGLTYSESPRAGDAWFLRFDQQGRLLFQKALVLPSDHTEVRDFVETTDGGFLLLGNLGAATSDLLLIKLGARGDLEWARTYGTPQDRESALHVQKVPDGFLLLATVNEEALLLLKIDENGGLLWQKRYFGGPPLAGSSLIVTPEGEIIVAGTIREEGQQRAFLWLLEADGQPRWQKWYQLGPYTLADSLSLWKGAILLGGHTTGAGVAFASLVMKVDLETGTVAPCASSFQSGDMSTEVEETSLAPQALNLESLTTGAEAQEASVVQEGSLSTRTICDPCALEVPTPQLALRGQEDWRGLKRFYLSVENWASFPPSLFARAPELPPCGLNNSSSRTWVDIYDQDGHYLYGFCALDSPDDLTRLWFAREEDQAPTAVRVVLRDRFCDQQYPSNLLPLRAETVVQIRANGQRYATTLSCREETARLRLSISLNPATEGLRGDYFLMASTPFDGCFCYRFPAGLWLPCPCQDPQATYTGALVTLDDLEVINLPCSGLPTGRYVLYFGVDPLPDGQISPGLVVDQVEITIE